MHSFCSQFPVVGDVLFTGVDDGTRRGHLNWPVVPGRAIVQPRSPTRSSNCEGCNNLGLAHTPALPTSVGGMYSLHSPSVTVNCVWCYRIDHCNFCTKFIVRLIPQVNRRFTDFRRFPCSISVKSIVAVILR